MTFGPLMAVVWIRVNHYVINGTVGGPRSPPFVRGALEVLHEQMSELVTLVLKETLDLNN